MPFRHINENLTLNIVPPHFCSILQPPHGTKVLKTKEARMNAHVVGGSRGIYPT